MRKNHLFIGTFYAALFGTSLLLVGCDALPNLLGGNDNNRPYYSNPNNKSRHQNNYNYNRQTPRAETDSQGAYARNKAANTTTRAAQATANDSNNSDNTSRSSTTVAPKASATAGSALDSPVVPTMTPAVDQ